MLSDIKEKISDRGICNKLLGSTLKQLGCRLTLFLSGLGVILIYSYILK